MGRRLSGFCGAVLALAAVACTSVEDRRTALIDGLVQMAATDEPVEETRVRRYFATQGLPPLRRLEITSAVLEDGRTRESIDIEFEPPDCVTPAMIRDRTGISFDPLPGGPPPMPPPLYGPRRVDPRPRVPSPGIEFRLDTDLYRVVLAIAGNDLRADACVRAFTLRRISPGGG